MKEHNYTIPLNEALEADATCFLCKIEDELEERALDYYMGAAVMEPGVRIAMNASGFCRHHAEIMLAMPKKLPLMLAMETRLDTVAAKLKKEKKPHARDKVTCAVCERVHGQMDNCLENCIWLMQHEPEFLEKVLASEGVCMHHFHALSEKMGRHDGKIYAALHAQMEKKLTMLREEIKTFTRSFDYQTAAEKNIGKIPPKVVETLAEKRG